MVKVVFHNAFQFLQPKNIFLSSFCLSQVELNLLDWIDLIPLYILVIYSISNGFCEMSSTNRSLVSKEKRYQTTVTKMFMNSRGKDLKKKMKYLSLEVAPKIPKMNSSRFLKAKKIQIKFYL